MDVDDKSNRRIECIKLIFQVIKMNKLIETIKKPFVYMIYFLIVLWVHNRVLKETMNNHPEIKELYRKQKRFIYLGSLFFGTVLGLIAYFLFI